MAVKDDIDICLNITEGNENPKKQSSQILNNVHIKRLKKNSNEKIKKTFQKLKSTDSLKNFTPAAKTRVKQKSLAAIVANNLKKVNNPHQVPKKSILKKSNTVSEKKSNEQLSTVGKVKNALNKKKEVNFSQNQDTDSNENLVSFTKPSKENAIKTILAKKRRDDTNVPKKSLSNIFKIDDSTKISLLENNTNVNEEDKFVNKKKKIEPFDGKSEKISIHKENSFKKTKKLRDKEKDESNKKEFKERTYSHHGGKMSSLFGNNPLVPHIGQRFVKPVNEKVFSAEKFSELGIHSFSVSNLEQNMNITTMTTVQKKAIPVILSGNDVLIRSQTGSGKTLSYALPIIEKLQSVRPKLSRNIGIKALIIVPTRELALQTYECFLKLIKPFTWIVPGYLIGGEKRKAEKARLRKGCCVLVATPGRLLDHIKHTKALNLKDIEYFILDEADRMLDMGYEKDISEIVSAIKNYASGSDYTGYNALKILREHMKSDVNKKNEKQRIMSDEMPKANEENHSNEINKNCISDSDGTGYNALKILRDHMKSGVNKKSEKQSDNSDDKMSADNKKNHSNEINRNRSTDSDDTRYNALKILRDHIKLGVNKKSEKQSENSDKISKTDNKNHSNEINKIDKSQYHSDSDENSEDEIKNKNSESAITSSVQEEESEKEKISESDKAKERQTILLSATLTHAVEKLAGLTMHNPIFVDAAKENIESAGGNMNELNEDLVVPQSVIQSYIITPPKLRMVTLSAYIAGKCQNQGNHKILVFMATQDMVDYHTEILSSVLSKPINEEDEDSDPLVDVEFLKLHGNMTQKERTEVFKTFRQAESGVLLCTDVAARGLDLPKVDTIVQYTGPTSTRDYVHRIGRTARAGSSGTAVIFLTPPEIDFVRMLESRRIRIKQDEMDEVLSRLLGPLSIHNSVQAAAVALQNEFESLVVENKKFYAMACKAYTSWIRFYSSYPREMRDVFNRRSLHLGHYAKSFALRDPPQKIGGAGKAIRERELAKESKPKHQNRLSYQRANDDGMPRKRDDTIESQRQQDRRSGMLKKVKMLNVSEYDSGLEPIKKPKKS